MSRRRNGATNRDHGLKRGMSWLASRSLLYGRVVWSLRLALVIGSLIATGLAFGPIYRATGLAWGSLPAALAALPAAWYWGWPVGFLVAIFSSSLNTYLYWYHANYSYSHLLFTFFFTLMLQSLFAGVVGYLRSQSVRLAREVAERQRAEAELKATESDLHMVHVLNASIVRGDDLDTVIETLCGEARRAFGAYATIVLLADDEKKHLISRHAGVPAEAFGDLGEAIQERTPRVIIPMDESTLHGRTLAAGVPHLVNDPNELDALMGEFGAACGLDDRTVRLLRRQLGVRSVIQLPLISNGEPLGVLDIPRSEPFTEDDLRRLGAVSGQLAAILRRTLTERALQRSLGTYRALVEATPLGVTLVDAHGVIKDISDAALCLVGAEKREQMLGRSIFDLVARDQRGLACRSISALLEGGSNEKTIFRIERLDGSWLLGAVSTAVLTDDEGQRSAVLLTVRDVTEQVKAQKALRASEARYRGLFEASRDGIAYTTLKGRVVDANPSFLKMLGYTLEEIQQLTYMDLTPRKWARMEEGIIRNQVMVRGYSDEYAKEYIRADGSVIPIMLRASLVHDSEGKPSRMMGIVRDVSDRRQLEARLRQAEQLQAIGRLAGGVSHEFNNLLTVINGYAQMLLAMLPEGDSMRPDLETIVSAGNRAAAITAQLLAFSRQEVVARRMLDLNAALRNMERLLRPILGKDIELVMHLAPEVCSLWADPGQIEQVVINLATNAARAMEGGGLLALRTELLIHDGQPLTEELVLEAGAYVRLTVSDTGHGMTPEVQHRVFEPFFTTRQVGEGTGLGLALVHGIVHQMNGDISVYSQVGRGTTFTIYFPYYDASEGDDPFQDEAEAIGGDEMVLFVEDEAVVLGVTKRLLEGLGYAVVATDDPEMALTLYAENADEIDLVVTDVVMPGLNGLELAHRLRDAGCAVPILFVSGYPEAVLARQGAAVPRDQLLFKPFGRQELAQRLRKTLDADGLSAATI